jgi:glycosyltransferase involved in cell wall biosynthesis
LKKLAVLLPSYNAALYIKESVDSILNQTFSDFDLYIYDDFSIDNTEEIISEYNDSRLFYRKNIVNIGIAKTLNRGLEELLPNYEYIARMDADDWSYPERFRKQIDFLENNKETVMCGTQGYWLKDINQNPISGWEYPTRNDYIQYYLLFAASFGHSSVFFRSNSLKKHNLRYDENISTCEDWDLWIRVKKIGQVANLPDFLMKYRILENSNHRSSKKIKKHLGERSIIISNYWANFGIHLSPEEVFYYYYGDNALSQFNFINKIKILINEFNQLYLKTSHNLNPSERMNFSYMLARRILNYWKRTQVSRLNPMLWFIIVKEITFINKIKLIKSLIR